MPDNYVTAMYTLFGEANLAMPLSPSFPDQPAPSDADAPVLVYGASASSGQYTVQTFKLAGYNNIFAIASQRNHAMLKELGAAHCFDYRSPDLVKNILAVTGGRKIAYAVDTIAVKTSLKAIAAVSDGNTRAAFLLPFYALAFNEVREDFRHEVVSCKRVLYDMSRISTLQRAKTGEITNLLEFKCCDWKNL